MSNDQLPPELQLSPDTLPQINDALSKIQAAKVAADMATRAGFNVEAQTKALQDAETRLNQIKQVYYPGQP